MEESPYPYHHPNRQGKEGGLSFCHFSSTKPQRSCGETLSSWVRNEMSSCKHRVLGGSTLGMMTDTCLLPSRLRATFLEASRDGSIRLKPHRLLRFSRAEHVPLEESHHLRWVMSPDTSNRYFPEHPNPGSSKQKERLKKLEEIQRRERMMIQRPERQKDPFHK